MTEQDGGEDGADAVRRITWNTGGTRGGGLLPPGPARRRLLALSLAVVGAVTLSDCVVQNAKAPSAAPPSATAEEVRPELRAFYGQKLAWTACGSLQCATLSVPMDYSRPGNGRTFTLPLVRHLATDPGGRIGSLVFDPGGPGGSGVSFLKPDGVDAFSKQVQARFDIVGFDPRGVAGSTPAIDCTPQDGQDDQAASATPVPLYPRTAAERAAALAEADRTARDCRARSGELLPYVGTLDAARDLDVLRAALGDAKLSYLGWSYGTYLATVYAEQFPQRVRALVLDGAIDPSLDWSEEALHQAKGFQHAVDDYAQRCAAVVGQDCPAATPDGIRQVITDLYAKVARHPLKIKGSTERLDQAALNTAVTMSMYSPESQWQPLSEALTAARRGDGAKLAALAHPDQGDQGGQARRDTTPPTPGGSADGDGQAPDNSADALLAVTCLDTPHPTDPQTYWDALDGAYRYADVYGTDSIVSALACRGWPTGPLKPHRVNAPGLPPVLVVGTTGDPATPYEEAQSLAGQLPGGMLLTFDGPGHTAYGRSNNCVTDAVDGYLVDLKPVRPGSRC